VKHFIQFCFTITLLLIFVGSANAGTQINTTDRGFYPDTGAHNPNNDNYLAGFNGSTVFHDFFVFNLSSVDTPICAASLVLFNPAVVGYQSPDETETFGIFDVTTDIGDLIGGTAGVAGFDDLGTGVSFGSTTVSAADNGQFVTVNLNNDGINALNAAAGGQIAIGGALTTLDQMMFISEVVFANTSSLNPQDGNTFLNLGCPSGPTVIIPTMGQWGMVIASVILGFFAIIRLRRIKDSELE